MKPRINARLALRVQAATFIREMQPLIKQRNAEKINREIDQAFSANQPLVDNTDPKVLYDKVERAYHAQA